MNCVYIKMLVHSSRNANEARSRLSSHDLFYLFSSVAHCSTKKGSNVTYTYHKNVLASEDILSEDQISIYDNSTKISALH